MGMRSTVRDTVPKRSNFILENKTAYIFLIPFFVTFGLFYVYPILWGPWMSFHEFTFNGQTFAGLENYRRLLVEDQFLTALVNTLFISVIVIPVQVVVALLFAVLLNSQFTKFKKIMRAGYLVPVVMSTTILAIIFDLFLNQGGLINTGLQNTFGFKVNWLTDPLWAKISVASVLIWRRLGISILIYLAGLQGIPENLYRAAEIDGAGPLQQFRHITIPQLWPITLVVVILSTSRTLRAFATPFVLTGGGPGNASKTVIQLIYEVGFSQFQLGYAATMGTVFALFIGLIMIVQYRLGGSN
jgi:ABC-type sugar transport system permease subunit